MTDSLYYNRRSQELEIKLVSVAFKYTMQ